MLYYVICPYGRKSGGYEALHQLVYYLKKNGKEAYMVYSNLIDKKNIIDTQYSIYIDSYLLLDEIVDSDSNAIIVPETMTYLFKKFNKLKKYIWWLSVDNYKKRTSLLFKIIYTFFYPLKKFSSKHTPSLKSVLVNQKYKFFHEDKKIIHLCASFYAFDFVKKRSNNQCFKFIEPISLQFLDKYLNTSVNCLKEKIVLYNPIKSGEFIEKLKRNSKIRFIPLIKMNQNELIELYSKAMVYVDFGPFPGAERMPKEAVLYGCCIITGLHGASAFDGDVPIDQEYKFDESKVDTKIIIKKIEEIFENYEYNSFKFNRYRNTVLNLEQNFEESIRVVL